MPELLFHAPPPLQKEILPKREPAEAPAKKFGLSLTFEGKTMGNFRLFSLVYPRMIVVENAEMELSRMGGLARTLAKTIMPIRERQGRESENGKKSTVRQHWTRGDSYPYRTPPLYTCKGRMSNTVRVCVYVYIFVHRVAFM